MRDVSAIFDWLVDGAPGASSPVDVLAKMLPALVDAGIELWGVEAFVRTLHPHIVGRRFRWMGAGVEVAELSWSELHAEAFQRSAAARIFKTGEAVRVRLPATAEFTELNVMQAMGATDCYVAPLRFISGQVHAITYISKRAGGFTDDDIAALAHVTRPLARVGEIFALLRTATNLLDTYVGHDAGARILQGQIQRGDTTVVDSVIWFSDLRGFTSMSAKLAPKDIIAVLNDVFDCQVPAIEAHGGQVLKFIGDGLLAVFPVANESDRRRACDAALAASRAAFDALAALNALDRPPVRFGLALHVGEIAYGNIGGSSRLDFTCIGPAVNLAARLETLTGKLGRDVVVSADFAASSSAKLSPLGSFELKGIAEPVVAFGP